MGTDRVTALSRGAPWARAVELAGPEHAADPDLADVAYTTVKRRIRTCELLPGQRITERGLVGETGLGKTPVREALGRLVNEGLVDVMPRSGYRVRPLTLQDVDEIYEAWRIVWPAIVVLASQRITSAELEVLRGALPKPPHLDEMRRTTEFIVAVARNRRLARVALRLMESLEQLFYLVQRQTGATVQSPEAEAVIAAAIERRDEAGIREAARMWIDGSYASVLRALQQLPSVRAASLL